MRGDEECPFSGVTNSGGRCRKLMLGVCWAFVEVYADIIIHYWRARNTFNFSHFFAAAQKRPQGTDLDGSKLRITSVPKTL